VALLHKTSLVPSKLELLAGWAPSQRWFAGEADAAFENLASFRFDDPAGEVGIEVIFVRAGDGPVLQIPLTYRNEAVAGADHFLIGTMEHGVLGTRWVYDAAGDPVYLQELARVALTGDSEVELHYEVDGEKTVKEPNARANGSGTADASVPRAQDDHVPATRDDGSTTLSDTDRLTFLIARQPVAKPLAPDAATQTLTGTWTGQAEPTLLAQVLVRG
jgi:Maltokinase N-terminal cap domain